MSIETKRTVHATIGKPARLWRVYPSRSDAERQIDEWNDSEISSWTRYDRHYDIREEDGGHVIYETLTEK